MVRISLQLTEGEFTIFIPACTGDDHRFEILGITTQYNLLEVSNCLDHPAVRIESAVQTIRSESRQFLVRLDEDNSSSDIDLLEIIDALDASYHSSEKKLLEELSFEAPDMEKKDVLIDTEYVNKALQDIVVNHDLSQFIL